MPEYVYAHDNGADEVCLDGWFPISPKYIISRTSCRCGGEFAWLRVKEFGALEMVGCVCHTPLAPDA